MNKYRMLFWGSMVGGLQTSVVMLCKDFSILIGLGLSYLIWTLAVRYFEDRAPDFYGEDTDHDILG
jgi:hypothetical protein